MNYSQLLDITSVYDDREVVDAQDEWSFDPTDGIAWGDDDDDIAGFFGGTVTITRGVNR